MDSNIKQVRIWDIWVRLFHWLLAGAVLYALFNGLSGIGYTLYHQKVGEFILLLMIFRCCLLLIGSKNARLLALLNSPKAAMIHLRHFLKRDIKPERGHNPAGAFAVIVLISLVSFQAISGMFIADDPDFPLVSGAWFEMVSEDTMKTLRNLHEINANVLIGLIILHVLMVFAYLFYAGVNLIRPMITGYISWPASLPLPEVRFMPFTLGFVLALVIGIGGSWLMGWF